MKTEKQVKTLDNIEIFSVYKKTTCEVLEAISTDDHLAIVAELEGRVAKLREALKKSIQFGEYAEWAIDENPSLYKLDYDARQALAEDDVENT